MTAFDAYHAFADTVGLPDPPPEAVLTAAGALRAGDHVTGGTGSRYKGPDFTVTYVEKFLSFMSPQIHVEVRGDSSGGPVRLAAVPADTMYLVTRKATS